MSTCTLCGTGFEAAPFTIVTPEYRIEDVCGDCMNLYAWGITEDNEEAYQKLIAKMDTHSSNQKVKK